MISADDITIYRIAKMAAAIDRKTGGIINALGDRFVHRMEQFADVIELLEEVINTDGVQENLSDETLIRLREVMLGIKDDTGFASNSRD